MSKNIHFFAALLLVLLSCNKFEDAEVTERKTFVHFYSSAAHYIASTAEVDTDGGFILSGEVRYDNGVTDALLIKTDRRGRKLWEKVIPKGIINAIKPTANGYILAGDSIQLNPQSADVNELINTYAKLMIMDAHGNVLQKKIATDSVIVTSSNEDVTLTVDYHGEALAFDQSGNIVMLGSYRVPGEHQAAYLSAYDPSDISDSLWYRTHKSLDNDLINCHALHLTHNSNLAWASNKYTQEQNVIREYLGIYYTGPNSAPKNNSIFGESDDRNHAVKDICRSAVGYAAVGTYSETTGLNGNIYFLRIDAALNVVAGSERYIDGEDLLLNDRILDSGSRTVSGSLDEGLALTSTVDGFVLACAITSTPAAGNGGKDILLVKLDPVGNFVWKKLIGGTGDEVVTSIRETPDKGLLLFGTNTINGLSSMMLIKTDENGNLDN